MPHLSFPKDSVNNNRGSLRLDAKGYRLLGARVGTIEGAALGEEWMDHVRWSYVHRIKLMAQGQGFLLVCAQADDPDADVEEYFAAEQNAGDDAHSLCTLVEQATGARLFPQGVTLGEIEDFLESRAPDEQTPPSGDAPQAG